jgi:hypothetical protein
MLDIHQLGKLLEYNVEEDIKQFKKPALIYHYHYGSHVINMFDTNKQWQQEQENLKNQKLSVKLVDHVVTINKQSWNSKLWIYQPLDNNGKINEEVLQSMTNIMQDPLGLCIGYAVSGFCYLQLINRCK